MLILRHQKRRDFGGLVGLSVLRPLLSCRRKLLRALRCVYNNVIASGACGRITFRNVGERQRFYLCEEKHAACGWLLQCAVGVSCGSTAKCSHPMMSQIMFSCSVIFTPYKDNLKNLLLDSQGHRSNASRILFPFVYSCEGPALGWTPVSTESTDSNAHPQPEYYFNGN